VMRVALRIADSEVDDAGCAGSKPSVIDLVNSRFRLKVGPAGAEQGSNFSSFPGTRAITTASWLPVGPTLG
jgi:hypothetical protein